MPSPVLRHFLKEKENDEKAFTADVPPFEQGRIPEQYIDQRPRVTWDQPPEGTQSFAVVMSDPGEDFTNWSVYNIPLSARSVEEGDMRGADEGINGYGMHGYAGPAPPPGETHTYDTTVYALDTMEIGSPQEIPEHQIGSRTTSATLSG
jgi:Raf kinase inhibitor-like YbhB/YbcL family protein